MKQFSPRLLADRVISRRKELKMSQAQLAEAAGMNRSMLSRLESMRYEPSLDQLQRLGQVLDFDPTEVFSEPEADIRVDRTVRIAVAGTGYVGLSLAVLLA